MNSLETQEPSLYTSSYTSDPKTLAHDQSQGGTALGQAFLKAPAALTADMPLPLRRSLIPGLLPVAHEEPENTTETSESSEPRSNPRNQNASLQRLARTSLQGNTIETHRSLRTLNVPQPLLIGLLSLPLLYTLLGYLCWPLISQSWSYWIDQLLVDLIANLNFMTVPLPIPGGPIMELPILSHRGERNAIAGLMASHVVLLLVLPWILVAISPGWIQSLKKCAAVLAATAIVLIIATPIAGALYTWAVFSGAGFIVPLIWLIFGPPLSLLLAAQMWTWSHADWQE